MLKSPSKNSPSKKRKQEVIVVDDDDDTEQDHQSNGATAGSAAKVVNGIDSLLDSVDGSWKNVMNEEFIKPYFKKLMAFLEIEMRNQTIYPPKELIFNALNLCPFNDVKVVILGQDPYHGPGQAHGLSFSVPIGIAQPPSLKNIYKVAETDVSIKKPSHGNLECWGKQGVLLLNTCLTVRKGAANSHQKKGWEQFTDAVIRKLASREPPVVFMLWGKPAAEKKDIILNGVPKTSLFSSKNSGGGSSASALASASGSSYILTASHPSPLGAYQTSEPFMKSRCNALLAASNRQPIDWNVPLQNPTIAAASHTTSIGKAAAAGPDRDDEDEVKGQQAGNNMFKFFKLK